MNSCVHDGTTKAKIKCQQGLNIKINPVCGLTDNHGKVRRQMAVWGRGLAKLLQQRAGIQEVLLVNRRGLETKQLFQFCWSYNRHL